MQFATLLAAFCVSAEYVLVGCNRGTLEADDKFHMLISGGYIPETEYHITHLVSIRTMNHIEYFGDNHFCSGVILTRNIVMTAAHCVTDEFYATFPPLSIIVVYGIVNRLDIVGDNCRYVDEIFVHPEYLRYVKNDLALLRLSAILPNELSAAQSIVIRHTILIEPGIRCSIYGWGQIYKHGPYANEIMYLDTIVMDHDYCKQHIPHYDPERNICTKPDAGGEVCSGDMGSPMMCKGELAGIVGGGQGCEGIQAIKLVNYSYFVPWVGILVVTLGNSSGLSSSLALLICLLILLRLTA